MGKSMVLTVSWVILSGGTGLLASKNYIYCKNILTLTLASSGRCYWTAAHVWESCARNVTTGSEVNQRLPH